MKNKDYKFKFLMLLMILFAFVSAQVKQDQLFDKIVKLAQGNIEEVGINLSFNVDQDEKDVVEKIFSKLGFDNIDNVEKSTDHGNYSISFSGKKINGSIVNIKDTNSNSIVLNISEKSSFNNAKELKDNILKSLNLSNKNVKYSYNIKARILSHNISNINDKLQNFLKDNGSTNINSVKISNGFSTVAYTKQFDSINNGGNTIDLNYAIVSYSSGNFILTRTKYE